MTALSKTALLALMISVLDRLADGESFNDVVEDTGITARVIEAQREIVPPPRVLITVKGGIADFVADAGVAVEIWDWDNYESDHHDEEGVPEPFRDLAVPIGVPVTATPTAQQPAGKPASRNDAEVESTKAILELRSRLTYVIDPDDGDHAAVVKALEKRLLEIMDNADDVGLITDDIGAYVESRECRVVRVQEPEPALQATSEGEPQSYQVKWLIDIDATTAEMAARRALEIQRNPDSIATIFTVKSPDGGETDVDVSELLDELY